MGSSPICLNKTGRQANLAKPAVKNKSVLNYLRQSYNGQYLSLPNSWRGFNSPLALQIKGVYSNLQYKTQYYTKKNTSKYFIQTLTANNFLLLPTLQENEKASVFLWAESPAVRRQSAKLKRWVQFPFCPPHRGIVQLGERQSPKLRVEGSNPPAPANNIQV